MDSKIPMNEFEREFDPEFEQPFAAPDAPPRHLRAHRFRTAAILLMIVAVACFVVDVLWIILSRHEPAGLRLFSAVCAAISVFFFRQFPVPKRVRG
jgi:hypothetical protein